MQCHQGNGVCMADASRRKKKQTALPFSSASSFGILLLPHPSPPPSPYFPHHPYQSPVYPSGAMHNLPPKATAKPLLKAKMKEKKTPLPNAIYSIEAYVAYASSHGHASPSFFFESIFPAAGRRCRVEVEVENWDWLNRD